MNPTDFSPTGKYDPLCALMNTITESQLTLLVVLGGSAGDGFSVTTTNPALTVVIPAVLRRVADDIEKLHKARGGC